MSSGPAVEIVPATIWRVPTAPADLVNSYLLQDDDGQLTLVDCGAKRAPRKILHAIESIGCGPSDVTRIVLTHAHTDHAGGLSQMRGRTGAPVAVHERDAAYVRTGKAPVRDRGSAAGRAVNRLGHGHFPPVEVNEELVDGQLLPVAGGVRVVHTPGHTPGHVSLLHEDSGVLITGDAIFNVRRLRWPLAPLCTDVAHNRRTAGLLGDLDYSTAAFSHGPEIRDGAREAVRGFLRAEGVRT